VRPGLPLADERTIGAGKYVDCQHLSIYSSPATGTHEVRGAIRDCYRKNSWLGFPVSDQENTPDGKGSQNRFEHGTIVWYPGQEPVAQPSKQGVSGTH